MGDVGAMFVTDGMPERMPVASVQDALEKSGLNSKLAAEIRKRGCFSRAKSKLKAEGLILEVKRKDDTGRWLWQLSDKFVESNKLGITFKAHFWFDTKNQTVGASEPDLASKIELLFAEYGNIYIGGDMTRLVHRIFMECKGLLPLRRAGGVYFIPEQHLPTLEKVMQFLADIGATDCWCRRIGCFDENNPDDQKLRLKGIQMTIETTKAKVKQITDEIAALEAKGDELSKTKAKNRLAELQDQVEKVRTFAQSLGADANELLAAASTEQIKLAQVACNTTDSLAAMAQCEDNDLGCLASIVKAATKTKEQDESEKSAEAAAEETLSGETITPLEATPVVTLDEVPEAEDIFAEA